MSPSVLIEFSGSEIRLAAWGAGSPVSETVPFSEMTREASVRDVRRFLDRIPGRKHRRGGLSRLKLIWSFPRHWVFVRSLTDVAESDRNGLEKKALGALEALPFGPDQLLWTLQQRSPSAPVRLIAARKDRVLPWIGFFEELGNWPDEVFVHGTVRGSGDSTSGRRLEIRRDADWYDLRVSEGTKLLSNRILPLGGTPRPESRLLEECRSVLAESEPAGTLQSIVTFGLNPESCNAISDAFLLPVRERDLGDRLPDLEDEILDFQKSTGDLRPPKVRKARFLQALSDEWSRMAVGFGVLSLLWVFLGGVQWLSQFRELSRLRSELSELKPRTEKFDALLRKNDSSATGQARGEKVLGALCEIVRCIPQEMRLRSLSYWKGGKVVLQGDAPALAEIMSFMGRLEKSSGFSGVELTDSQAGKGGAEGRIDFEIRCNRRGGLEKNAG